MTGSVVAINSNRGMVGVLTENGDYSVFELLGSDEVEVGDDISWTGDTPLGGNTVQNETRAEAFDVFFQNHVSKSRLHDQLLF